MVCLFSERALSQNNNLIIDKNHQIFYSISNSYFVEKTSFGFVTFLSEQDAGLTPFDPFYTKFKKLDSEGNLIEENIISNKLTETPAIFKAGPNYRIISYIADNDSNRRFSSILMDIDFNLLEQQIINVPKCENCITNTIGNGVTYSNGDSLLYFNSFNEGILFPDFSSTEFSFIHDTLGYYNGIRHLNKNLDKASVYAFDNPFVGKSNGNFIVPSVYFTEYDSSLNIISRNINKFAPYTEIDATVRYLRVEDGLLIMKFIYDKLNSEFKINLKKVDFDYVLKSESEFKLGKHFTEGIVNNFAPLGSFFKDLEGNFNYYCSSNFDGSGAPILDTKPGKIIHLKLNNTLNSLCGKVYEMEGYQAHLYNVKYYPDGLTVLGGVVDTIVGQNGKKNYHPFIGIVQDGCDIPWAKVLYDSHLNSNEINNTTLTATLYPNPAREILYGQVNSSFVNKKFEIIDLLGNEVLKGNLSDLEAGIDISKLIAGIYFIKCRGGKIVKLVKI